MRVRATIAVALASLALAGAASASTYHPEFGGRIPANGTVTFPTKDCPADHMRVQSHVRVFYTVVHRVRLLVNPHAFSAGFTVLCNVYTK